jgi:hypothetical protein
MEFDVEKKRWYKTVGKMKAVTEYGKEYIYICLSVAGRVRSIEKSNDLIGI